MIKQAREHKKLKNLAMVEKILKNVEFFGSLKKRLNDAKMKELVSQLGYKTAIKGEYLYNKGNAIIYILF